MLLKTFERQLKNFSKESNERVSTAGRLVGLLKHKSIHDVTRPVPAHYIEEEQQGLSLKAIFQFNVFGCIVLFYACIT
jgi:hypothetical protein